MRRYLDQPLAIGQRLTLTDEDYNYIARVLRMRIGDEITLFNGLGGEYYGTIEAINRRDLTLKIEAFSDENRQSLLSIHLYQSLPNKGDKMDFLLQKATELGVSEITPLIAERSQFSLKPAQLEKRVERWRSIIAAACEQSGLNLPPTLNPPILLTDLKEEKREKRLILSPIAQQSLGALLKSGIKTTQFGAIIGPEGGFTPNEITHLESIGAQSVRLGKRILRTETAGLTIISALQSLLGDWAE